MLALLFRGFFLIGVLSWYSLSVWKMIDDYFKNQFQRYLQEEYQRNPKMRADVESYATAGKTDADVISSTVAPGEKVAEIPGEVNVCSVGTEKTSTESGPARKDASSCSSENEVANAFFHKNAVPETATGSLQQETGKKSGVGNRNASNNFVESEALKMGSEDEDADAHSNRSGPGETGKSRESEDLGSKKSKRKFRMKNVILTEENLETANNDFLEFDAEEEPTKNVPDGILVSELPFKPRADIGNLQRVSAEEYCPISLEEKDKCEETIEWP